MTTKKLIIWLEDNDKYCDRIREILEDSPFSLSVCSTLCKFKEETDVYKKTPKDVAGFVLDILIPRADDLGVLGLSQIRTKRGNDAGALVLSEFLRNVNNNGITDVWKQHKVLMLSCLSPQLMQERHGLYRAWEESQELGLTKWLSKGDSKGDTTETEVDVKNWLNYL